MKIIQDFTNYLKDSFTELKKVNWPSKKQVLNYTYVVVIVSIAVALFLGGLDYFFGWSLDTFILKTP